MLSLDCDDPDRPSPVIKIGNIDKTRSVQQNNLDAFYSSMGVPRTLPSKHRTSEDYETVTDILHAREQLFRHEYMRTVFREEISTMIESRMEAGFENFRTLENWTWNADRLNLQIILNTNSNNIDEISEPEGQESQSLPRGDALLADLLRKQGGEELEFISMVFPLILLFSICHLSPYNLINKQGGGHMVL